MSLETVSRRTTCHSTHECAGCGKSIPPGADHFEHELYRTTARPNGSSSEFLDLLHECIACAARNGRPGVAEPETPEQPLQWDGVA